MSFKLNVNAREFVDALSNAGGVAGVFKRTAVGAFSGIAASAQGLVSAMHQINGAVELVGRGLGALKSAGSQMTGALDLAGDLEQTKVAFRVMIGDATKANALIGEAKQLADESPYGDKEILAGVRALVAYGEGADTVVESLRRVGDVASGVNQPLNEIADIYGKARVQGTLFAEDINQLTGRGIPILQQFAKQLGVGVDQVKQMASEGKVTFAMLEEAFKAMTSEGGQFNGMMAEQSTTYKGLLSTLSAGWDNLKVAFSTPIMESLKPILEEGIGLIDSMKTGAEGVGKAIGDWVNYMSAAFKAGQGWDALMLDMQIGLLKVVNFFGGKMSGMFDFIGDQLDELVSGATVMLAKLNPMMGADEYAQFVETAADDLDKKKKDRAAKTAAGPFADTIKELMGEREKLMRKVDPNKDQRESAQAIGNEISAKNALAAAQNAGRDYAADQLRQEAIELSRLQAEELTKAAVAPVEEQSEAAKEQKAAATEQAKAAKTQLEASKPKVALDLSGAGKGRLSAAESLAKRYDRMSGYDKAKYGSFADFAKSQRLDIGSMKAPDLQRLRTISMVKDGKDVSVQELQSIRGYLESLGKNIGAM